MSDNVLPIYRIFLSSTAIDLEAHRKKAADAILRLGDLPVAMETFGATPNDPVQVCLDNARTCDALVVMIAHRYGWVPTSDEGGDGRKSITWLEVQAALDASKPVFAFLVDPNFGWTQPKEQDLLEQAKTKDEAMKVYEKVQGLRDFRTFLEREAKLTREIFTTPDDLALKLATSLSNWARKSASEPDRTVTERTDVFRVVHPLQPAIHFHGRQKLLEDLHNWWQDPVSPDRVCSLVAIGGAGKTAVVERFLNDIPHEHLRGSVLVWSFYEQPDTDAFLREACIVFAGEEGQGAGGRLERLQRALAGSEPHLLVLDGLERVQSTGTAGRARGDLEDHQLKNLLRSIAGGLGRTRALVTSRFELTDLQQWEGAGCYTHKLDELDEKAALNVLRAWKVRGEDEQLHALAKKVGRHALSVSVLGSYLHNCCNGDPKGAEGLNLEDITPDDTQAAKLARILAGYARDLPNDERDLLVRLSVFPQGVSVEILAYLVDAGGNIAGTLINADQAKLVQLAGRLKQRGLAFTYKLRNSLTYTAHPFLREYFRDLLGVPSEQIHEAVRTRLAPQLDTRPDIKPREPEMLDRYEALIEHSILAGHIEEADELYWYGLSGTDPGRGHLFHILCEYNRIVRILARFSEDGEPQHLAPQLPPQRRSSLINEWGLAARELGDLALAERCFDIANGLEDREAGDWRKLSQGLQNSAAVALDRGAFPAARKLLTESLDYAKPGQKYVRYYSHSYLAAVCHALGEISEAHHHFTRAAEVYEELLGSIAGIQEAEHLLALGDVEAARQHTVTNLATSEQSEWNQVPPLCHCLLGLLCLPDKLTEARTHLESVRDWTARSGSMECILRAHILAAEITRCAGDLPAALAEATTGLTLAESCGWGKLAIELLILLARIQLAVPDYRAALSHARKALDRAGRPDCRYAWAEADALHLCGLCHQGLSEHELARKRFEAAITVREHIEHPGLEETRSILRNLTSPS